MSLRIVLTDAYSWPDVTRGGERYLHELAAALSSVGHRVSVLTTGPRAGVDEVLGVPVRRVRRRAPWARRLGPYAVELAFGAQALARLAAAPVDVWHATSLPDAAAATALGLARPRLRTVFTDHGFPAAASRAKRPDERLQRLVARWVGAYVCVSQAAGQWLRDDYKREPVVVPPGVDCVGFHPTAARASAPVLLYSGSLDEPRKNVPLLLAAADHLLERHPDLQVWLLGPGDADRLVREAPPRVREAVTVTGVVAQHELVQRYSQAWATVLPSHAEAFGMTVVESWACGTPAVVLAGSGGPEETMRPGLGTVAAQQSPEALAAACAEAFGLAHDAATPAACRAEAERYDWRTAVVPRLEAVYAGAPGLPVEPGAGG